MTQIQEESSFESSQFINRNEWFFSPHKSFPSGEATYRSIEAKSGKAWNGGDGLCAGDGGDLAPRGIPVLGLSDYYELGLRNDLCFGLLAFPVEVESRESFLKREGRFETCRRNKTARFPTMILGWKQRSRLTWPTPPGRYLS